MRFVSTRQAGSADVLFIDQTQKPQPTAGELLIRVKAAGVNRPDVLQRMGLYNPPPTASPILGLEASGVVEECGVGVEGWKVGDRVCGLANGGGYAEFVSIPASQCLPIPENISFVEAAALPETCFTVWTNVFNRAGLRAGESFLVHGGSSGIGTTAIQIASLLGATVYTTAGSDEKCQACESLGAKLAINYRESDFVEVLKQSTEQQGINVVLDMVGGEYVAKNIDVCAKDARIVNIAFLQGSNVNIDMMPVMVKRLTLSGSTLRPQSEAEKAAIAKQLLNTVWPLLSNGDFKPVIHSSFDLEDVANAHRLMESSKHIGKIVLRVDA